MAYLAPPPADPIDIDPGVKYFYVIAQEGAGTITVDPDANFTFNVVFGSPATLTLKYIGTVLATPTYHSITIRVGSLVQTVNFRVRGNSPTGHLIPNITNFAFNNVLLSASISVQITSDIPASYSAENLLPSLSISAKGLITGTAPTVGGFYPIILVATANGYSYKRYFVFVVGTGSPLSSSITIGFVTPPDFSRCLFDGDFTQAQLAGPPQFEIPFKVDPKPYAYKLPFWQFLDNYTELEFGAPGPLGGTYVGGAPGTFKSIGGGIIEFWREFAVVPNSRNEYESFVYKLQFLHIEITEDSSSASVIDVPIVMQSRIQFDYFQSNQPETIYLPKAPKLVQVANVVIEADGWGMTAPGEEIPAEDATMKCWKGNIFERQTRFITVPLWWTL